MLNQNNEKLIVTKNQNENKRFCSKKKKILKIISSIILFVIAIATFVMSTISNIKISRYYNGLYDDIRVRSDEEPNQRLKCIKKSYVVNGDGNLVSDNLYNIANDSVGKALNQQGGTYDSSNQSTSEFIKLEPNTTYRISNAQWYNLYTRNSASSFTRQITSPSFTTTSEENYLRLTHLNSVTEIMLNKGSTLSSYTPYGIYYSQENYDNKPEIQFNAPFSKCSAIYGYSHGTRPILDKQTYFDFSNINNNNQFVIKNGSVSYTWKYTDFGLDPNLTLTYNDGFEMGIVYEWGQYGFDFTNYDSLYFFAGTIAYDCGFEIEFIDGYTYKYTYPEDERINQPLSIKSLGHGSIIKSMRADSTHIFESGTIGDASASAYTGPFGFYTTSEFGKGYNAGYNDAFNIYQDFRLDIINNPNEYNLYSQSQYDSHYQDGYNAGYNATNHDLDSNGFLTMMNAIFNAPANFLNGALNFDFMGVNLFNLVSFVFTCALVFGAIKLIL